MKGYMEAQRYRVVLTGELMEGYDRDQAIHALATMFKQPAEKLRNVFSRKPLSLNQELELAKARQVQARLHAVGAVCTLQAVGAPRPPAKFLTDEPPAPAKPDRAYGPNVTCPKCGQVQAEAPECGRCGIIFSKWRMEVVEQTGPDEEHLLNLFLGANAHTYIEKFERFRGKEGFALTWHWPAFFASVFWALYRKMWGVATLMFLLSIAPLSAFLLGLPWPVTLFLSFIVLLSPFVWGATANYLYYRKAKRRIAALGKLPDVEKVAAAGGTSVVAVLVGFGIHLLAGAVLGGMLFVNLKDKMMGLIQANESISAALSAQTPQTLEGQATAKMLEAVALATTVWMVTMEGDRQQVSLDIVANAIDEPVDTFRDGWGNLVRVKPTARNFAVISAGPDGRFGSQDDISVEPQPLPAN